MEEWMRTNIVRWMCFCACILVLVVPLFAQRGGDPLSGTWSGDWGPTPTHRNSVTVELKWDGKALTGTVNPGPTAVTLQKTTFDAATGNVHMEAEARGRGGQVHYVIDGKLANGTMSGSWNHDNQKGDFKITKK
jgi:hypothetical protein